MNNPTKEDKLAQVLHFDLYGKRENKYDFLTENNIASIPWNVLEPTAPNHFFVHKNFEELKNYEKGFDINTIFKVGNSGVVTKRDKLNIHNSKENVIQMLDDVINLNETECRKKYSIPDDVRDWNFSLARKDIKESKQNPNYIQEINYRPFDKRYFYYTGKSKGVVGWPVPVVSNHLLYKNNLGFMTNKKVEVGEFTHYIIYEGIVESHAVSMKEINYVFPLYLYPEAPTQQTIDQTTDRKPNLNTQIINQIAIALGLIFTIEKQTTKETFAPIDILDYIYAILHSPTYREKYKEFLKIDFPRVPYPKNTTTFWQLVALGAKLRQLHLLESPIIEQYITQYPIDGDNVVGKVKYENGKVFINYDAFPPSGVMGLQYFDNVPEVAWTFFIGGYQPAQKWLKDRKGRTLEFDDILHYQKIIVALTQTHNIMTKINGINIEEE